ncbi:MAG: ankyrin repeat domain-containing protein [Muribaculaceae bacterium]|nr:ankyrin repeat domain-containing protein [Muribaculaceae bacterium]
MNVKKNILRIIKIALSLYVLYWIIIFLTLVYNSFTEPHEYLSSDYRIFKDTPVWDLAKAVRDADTAEITYLVQEKKIPVDYQDKKYGHTLLLLAVYNENIASVKKLLELGADPNKYEDTLDLTGENVMITACTSLYPSDKILKLLLDYGGDPNSVTKGITKNGKYSFPFRQTALEAASRNGNIAKIKLLLNYGADVNFTPDRDYDTDPLREALYTEKMRAALCLLENGAKFDKEYINTFDKEKETILSILRKIDLPLDSEEYKIKLKIIDFLKVNGLDYSKEPIPDFMIKRIKRLYPNDWQEYMQKY